MSTTAAIDYFPRLMQDFYSFNGILALIDLALLVFIFFIIRENNY